MKDIPGISPISKETPISSGTPRSSLYTQVSDQLGVAICSGLLEAGAIFTVDELETATTTSRSVVREAVRVLASMGLLYPRKRVGLQVLPETEWNHFDPQVIRWRLSSGGREVQLRDLRELRLAIEPEAARLAAERRSPDLAGRIMSAAARLWSAGLEAEPTEFLQEDATLHTLILQASGNPMFKRVSAVIHEALRERNVNELHEQQFDAGDLQLHIDLANLIQKRAADDAWRIMREIITRTQ